MQSFRGPVIVEDGVWNCGDANEKDRLGFSSFPVPPIVTIARSRKGGFRRPCAYQVSLCGPESGAKYCPK